MSIAEILDTNLIFPVDYNVRLSIAGLAICKFTTAGSTIRFLRHVENHQLKMTVIKKLSNQIVEEVNYTLRKQAGPITFSGADQLSGYEYKPKSYSEGKYDLKMMLDLHFLHGHKLDPNPSPPSSPDSPTVMNINNCLFYTASLTEDKFDLKKNESLIQTRKRFGEVLGGYMKVTDALTINIPNLFPSETLILPMKDGSEIYKYEIQFNNSCFDEKGKPCSEQESSENTDFLRIYDLLIDSREPIDKFDLKPIKSDELSEVERKSINTGACLPVVEEPLLN